MENIAVLKQIPLFSSLTAEEFTKVVQIVQENFYPAGQFLFHENDLGERAYIIKSGKVEVLRSLGTPNETFLGVSGPGELIGEMAILEEEARSASVRALEDTATLEITGEDFEKLISENGTIGYQVVKMLSHRMRQAGDYRSEQRAEMAKFEREMEIARRIQSDFLPDRLPQPPGWQIAARFQPARAVGGDFYDVFPLVNNRVGIVIADVCGKGVGASLFMALIRSLIRAFAGETHHLGWLDIFDDENPQTNQEEKIKRRRQIRRKRSLLASAGASALLAIEDANNYIANNHGKSGMFATLFFGVLDPASGVLTYINGGHNPPFIINSDGEMKIKINPTGPVIGMMPVLALRDIALQSAVDFNHLPPGVLPNMEFDIERVSIDPGDSLILYTDGVTEARSPDNQMLTEEGLVSLLAAGQETSADGWLDRVETGLQAHVTNAEQSDDITILAVRRNFSN